MSQPATGPSPMMEPRAPAESQGVLTWQRRLLPFTMSFLVLIAVGFFALSLFDVIRTQAFVREQAAKDVRPTVESLLRVPQSAVVESRASDTMWQSLLVMEADAIDKRYRQASALLMSRIWTRQLAFITGMVLALIGCVFILSKLREERADVNLGAQDWKAGMSSTSPGLVLSFLGTILVGIALVVQPKIDVKDHPVYFAQVMLVRKQAADATRAAPPHSSTDSKPIDPFTLEPVAGQEKTPQADGGR